ncbi:Carboxylic ester hydrolase [Meloidogyne graminicola]|uniref:Carboxylic ester hydrolase n=1 Tax=Meloidogyne graminicola TaxID=189291 RepID=A0A8T0A104_9BILA|nr:Carboxylic ester hydrolase [Meloidogyne graminicola]
MLTIILVPLTEDMNKLFLYFISFIYVFYKMRKRRRKTSTFFCSINFINNYHHFSNSFLVLLFCCLFLFVLCLLPVHGRSTQFDTGDVLIKTTLGKIRGFRQNFDGKSVVTFFGVPYAQKPIGVNRFSLPEMLPPWEGEFRADKPSRTCFFSPDTMFPDFPGAEMWNPSNDLGEDCLSMNIWVPELHDGTVLVWIYGGGFYSGSPSLDLYDGRILSIHERALVININYRLGAFGFLYLGDDTPVPGNMGLHDQQMALRWIHDHIAHFGGDPRRVTLFGESAGSASAMAHMFADDSHNFFSRVIAQSGSIINNWATKPKSSILLISLQLVQRLNCSNNITKAMENTMECLRNVPTAIVQRATNTVSESLKLPMDFAFVPIDEDIHFFRGNLFDKLRRKLFKRDVSILLGTVRDEGTYWLPYYLQKYGFGFNHTVSPEDLINQALVSESEYGKAFDAFLPYFGNSNAYSHLSKEHTGNYNVNAPERWRDGVARFLGDYFFTCDSVKFADIVSDEIYGSVFSYYFTRRSSANPWPLWMGVMHGYEIEYVFGLPLRSPHNYDPDELELEIAFSTKIMEFWGHFARTDEPVEFWPKYNRITRKSLVLNEEIARGSSHRIYVDVHGKICNLLEEAQLLAGLSEGLFN